MSDEARRRECADAAIESAEALASLSRGDVRGGLLHAGASAMMLVWLAAPRRLTDVARVLRVAAR